MKNESNKAEKNISSKILINGISIAVLTSVLISIFLSGKIIYIPKGTHEGGVISAIGVGIIIVFMIIVGIIMNRISQQKSKIRK
jgi:hydrogenase-4 membrane subunit HyfE